MRKRLIYILCTCVSVMLTFCSCTDDSADGTKQVRQQELHISLGSHQLDITRASGDLPSDFVPYSHGDRTISQIQCYMAYEKDGGQKYIPCVFNHVESESELGHIWTSRVPLYTLTDGTYYLYGFMPKESVGSGVTIEPYGSGEAASFASGCVMTLTGLNAVMPDDICVIVGAKGYDGTNIPDMTDRLGKFDYYPDRDDNGDPVSPERNNLYLLVDHLYAGLEFQMSLGTKYSQLRGIKVRNIKLIPEDGNNEVIETVTAKVTIVANNIGYNPIVPNYTGENVNIGGSVEYKDFVTGTNPKPALLFEGEKELTLEPKTFMACFCPATNKKFTLETTYDVYDRKKNLIREGETARNAIELKRDMTAGQVHVVNITVQPTYLYMLSDPDLDNPTFEVK